MFQIKICYEKLMTFELNICFFYNSMSKYFHSFLVLFKLDVNEKYKNHAPNFVYLLLEKNVRAMI